MLPPPKHPSPPWYSSDQDLPLRKDNQFNSSVWFSPAGPCRPNMCAHCVASTSYPKILLLPVSFLLSLTLTGMSPCPTHISINKHLSEFNPLLTLEGRVASFSMHQNHLDCLLAGPHLQSFWFNRSGAGLGICISNKFPADANAAGPGNHTWRTKATQHLLTLQLLLECHLTTSLPQQTLFCKWTLFDAQTPKLLPTGLPFLLSQTKHRTLCFDVYKLGSNLHFPLVHGGAPSSIQLSKHSSNVAPSGNLLREHKDLQSASFCSLLLPGAAHYPTHCPRHSFQSPSHQCSFSIYQKTVLYRTAHCNNEVTAALF